MQIIKELRRKIGISQTKLAQEIGVSLRTIQLYERKGANIPMKNLTKLAHYFDMTIGELFMHESNDPRETYAKKGPFTKHGSVFYPLEYGKYLAMSPLVLMEQQKEYIAKVKAGKISKNAFQTGFVVDFVDEEPHTAFEITGDSMSDGSINSIPNKAIVLGKQLDVQTFAKENASLLNKPYILVCMDRIICKIIMGFNADKQTIQCHNLNKSPEYQNFDLPLKDVLQILRIAKKQL